MRVVRVSLRVSSFLSIISPVQASGALSADEIAVLRPSDLSLEGVISLADLPIPGFPKSARADTSRPQGGESEACVGDGDGGNGEEDMVDEDEEMMEFADTDVGAAVVECSSNSETSGGMLQVRKSFASLFFALQVCCRRRCGMLPRTKRRQVAREEVHLPSAPKLCDPACCILSQAFRSR